MSNGDQSGVSKRRTFLKIAGASGAVALAGCSGGNSGNGGNGSTTTSQPATSSSGTTTGTTSGSSSASEVVIGSNHPLSGALASTGVKMDDAVKLAAARKNANGGIQSMGGAKVKVVSGDNQGKQSLGGQVTDNLISKGATVLTGCYSSPVTTAATQASERKQTPFVISVAADDAVLKGRGLNYTYRPQPPAQRMAKDYAEYVPKLIRNNGGTVKTAGLFYVNNSYGQAIRDHLKTFLPQQNVKVSVETALAYGANSADTQVTKLKQNDPDTVIATTYVPGGVLLSQAMQNQSYKPNYLTACASATFLDDSALQNIGGFANGVLDNNYALNDTIQKTTDVRQAFKSQYSKSMDGSTGMAYVAAEVIIAAVEKAGSADSEAINNALKNIQVSDHIAAMGTIEFQSNGENKNALAPVSQVQNLTAKVVSPKQYAEASPQF